MGGRREREKNGWSEKAGDMVKEEKTSSQREIERERGEKKR